MKKALLTKIMLLLCALIAGSSSVWATTYKLTSVTSVSAGNKYVFVRNSRALGNSTSSSALQTTTYSTSGLTGSEAYVWLLETATGGFYLKNASKASNQYLNNASSTTVTFGSTNSIWTITFENSVALIQNSSNSNRFLGDTGSSETPNNAYKAYATDNLSSHPHDFTVYLLEAEGSSTYTVTYAANGGTGTMTDANSPYAENANVTLLSNTFTAPEGYIWSSWSVKDASNNDVTVTDGKFTMPASNVTVKAQWVIDPSAPFVWAETSLAGLTSSDVFVIVGTSSAGSFSLENNGMNGAPIAKAVTISEGKITSIVSDANRWNVTGNATDGYTFYPNGDDAKWLYCTTEQASGANDNMRVGTGDRKVFKLENNYLITKDDKTDRYLCVYGSQDWRGYISASPATTIKFYKKADANQPSITANDVEIDWNANGSIAYGITNPVGGGILTANTTADWITIGTINADNVSFTATANSTTVARNATVTLTYTYNTNQTVTKDVTITQAAGPYSTISDLFDAAATTAKTVLVTFNNWVVSGISTNGKNVFVTDGTNGFVIYNSSGGLSSTYAVGNILSGTGISCSLKKNNGNAQISDLASTPTINTGGTVSEANIDMDALAGVNTGALVSYDNLTCSVDGTKYYLSDGTTQLQVYSTLYAFGTLKAGMKYNITGIYQQYNSTKEILPRSAADIVEVAAVITPAKTYTTLTAASALDFTGLANLEAYIVKDNDAKDGYVTLTQVNKVPANTGLVLKATSTGSPIDVPVFDGTGADDVTGNLMAGSATATTAIVANAGYILKDGAFHPANAGTLPAGKAYLNIPVSAPVLLLNFDDDVTNISQIEKDVRIENVYDLQGRKVAQPTKGLYIVNGKKYVVK